jgi:hypothetical protein
VKAKRLVTKLALVVVFTVVSIAGCLAAGLSSSEFSTPACACGTVSMEVVRDLDQLDGLVRQYAVDHDGKFPAFGQLVALVTDKRIRRNLTSQVDVVSGAFTFTPARADVYRIGYAVSDDGNNYILLGVGLTEKYAVKYLFGHWVGRESIGYEFPILHPGDVPPEPSPLL